MIMNVRVTHLEDTSEACLSSSAVSLVVKDFFHCDCEPFTKTDGGCEPASAGEVSGWATVGDVAGGELETADRDQGTETDIGLSFEATTG